MPISYSHGALTIRNVTVSERNEGLWGHDLVLVVDEPLRHEVVRILPIGLAWITNKHISFNIEQLEYEAMSWQLISSVTCAQCDKHINTRVNRATNSTRVKSAALFKCVITPDRFL